MSKKNIWMLPGGPSNPTLSGDGPVIYALSPMDKSDTWPWESRPPEIYGVTSYWYDDLDMNALANKQ